MHDKQTRMPHATDVLSHVRFALLDQSTLNGLLQTDMGLVESCRQLILEAMAYHSYPSEMKQGIDWPRSKPRTKMEKKAWLAFTEDEIWIFTPSGWEQMEVTHGSIGAATAVGNVLYVMLEFMSAFKSYDPIENIWNDLPLPPECGYRPRTPQMTSVGTRLFLVQGTDSSKSRVCCYDICEGQWTLLPTLSRYSAQVSLASCEGVVFAIGGEVKVSGYNMGEQEKCVPTSVVETFFPPNNSWEAVAPTVHPHSEATAMVQGDIIYIAGGKTFKDGQITSSTIVEMCRAGQPVTMKASPWSVVPQPLCVHKFASKVAVIDRKAYFLLGGQMHFTGKFVDSHTSEEDVDAMSYSFHKDIPYEVKVCATLAMPRSGDCGVPASHGLRGVPQ
ncbi:kelch-like protein 3 [Branchiostoma lanceolatum]|uniref:kelch-like protein 3 n=1 Tax=Branchiostoma lanceolatum TaxID=7740 RepID=UPI003455CA5C